MSTTKRGPIKIASISGYSGDRLDALSSVLSGAVEVDAIVGDYLAEMNLSWRKAEMNVDASRGADPMVLQALQAASKQLGKRLNAGTFPKLVLNAGALNPHQLALDTRALLTKEFGDRGAALNIAYITGDDVLGLLETPGVRSSIKHLTTGETLDEWPHKPIIANAYIGQFAFVAALRAGADIILAGRATDASSTQALATWWHNWSEEEYDNHALGLVSGHLIECGNYVTGGNFCGFKRIQPYHTLAFPIAEIHGDGHSVITKQPGQNGVVSVDTVRSQLLYEIQGRYYYNPDVVADLSTVTVAQIGPDRVDVSGCKGLPPPPTLKVAIQAAAGFQAEMLVYAMGLDIEEKARSLETQLREDLLRIEGSAKQLRKLEVQLLGRSAHDPTSSDAATAVVRIFMQTPATDVLPTINLERLVMPNLGQSFPGFTPNLEYHRTTVPRPYFTYFPGLISRSEVSTQVHWLDDEHVTVVPHSTKKISDLADVKQESYEPTNAVALSSFGSTIKVPLGHNVFARSGDKGSNVNVGFFPQGDSPQAWDWLRSFLTTEKLLKLLGEDAQFVTKVERVEFPKIRGVHFVLFDLLGGGVVETSRPDSLGKGLAEFLRARIVDYPEKLYNADII